jgi:hypothetical protein
MFNHDTFKKVNKIINNYVLNNYYNYRNDLAEDFSKTHVYYISKMLIQEKYDIFNIYQLGVMLKALDKTKGNDNELNYLCSHIENLYVKKVGEWENGRKQDFS